MPNLKSKAQVKDENKLKEALANGREFRKGKAGIDKKQVTVAKGAGDTGAAVKSPGVPTAEQLSRINEFTRTPKTEDEVYVLETLSANNLPDRDDDYFDDDTLKQFAELPQPYSSIGKSYMVGHDYSNLPQGRIFGVGQKEAEGAQFLTNEVYIPRTASNESFIESVDFGVNWAVSVGVLLEAQLCSICKAPQYGGWFYGGVCETGHFKGSYYDPAEDRTDDWGYIIEAREGDSKAVKALGNMNGAKDFYELSQVFLGAQYFAALDKSAGVVKALKSVSKSIPILGLSTKDALEAELPLQHVDARVAEALQKFTVKHDKDGSMSWVDGESLTWNYTPGDAVTCLGKSAEAIDEEGSDDSGEGTPEAADREAGSAGEGGASDGEQGSEHGGSADEAVSEDDPGVEDHSAERAGSDGDLTTKSEDDEDDESEDPDDESEESEDDDTEEQDKAAAQSADVAVKAALLAAIKTAKLPGRFTALAVEAGDNGLFAVLRAAGDDITRLNAEVSELTPKAALGDTFKKAKRAEAIAAYVRAKGMGKQIGVDTTSFEKVLDSLGDNIELIESVTADYAEQARAKLPAGTVRSTAAGDPNEHKAPNHGDRQERYEYSTDRAGKTVSRLHG